MHVYAAGDNAGAVRCADLDASACVSVVEHLAGNNIDNQTPSLLEQLKSEDRICVLVELQRAAAIKIDQPATADTSSHSASIIDDFATVCVRPIHEHLGSRDVEYPNPSGSVGTNASSLRSATGTTDCSASSDRGTARS